MMAATASLPAEAGCCCNHSLLSRLALGVRLIDVTHIEVALEQNNRL